MCDGSQLTNLPATGWSLSGNTNVTANQFVGTTDMMPLEFRVNGITALQVFPTSQPGPANIVAGGTANTIGSANIGSVIAGGGGADGPHLITGDYSVTSGGLGNESRGQYQRDCRWPG